MIFNPRHLFIYRNWLSFLFIVLLSCVGLLFIYSATHRPYHPYSAFFIKQAAGLAMGLVLYFAVSCIDYRVMMRWGYGAYWCVIILLMFTLVKGSIGMGGQRWINLVFFKFQPSELAKLCLPAYTVYELYSDPLQERPPGPAYARILGMLLLSFLLIRKQPDLGTALIVLFSGMTLLWIAGLSRRFLTISILICFITAPVMWHFLKEYQKKRILVFFGYGDQHKERYQIEQSKIAIGSGGLYGKGLLKGTQNQLNFLPESRTDFIFSVIAEEWGLAGALCVLVLYFLFILHLLAIVIPITDASTQLLAVGLILPIIFSAFINMYMVTELLPTVGIPLPLISYGLSNLWTTLISLGWFESIAMHRLHLTRNAQTTLYTH